MYLKDADIPLSCTDAFCFFSENNNTQQGKRPSTLTEPAADDLGLVHMVLWLVLLISLLAPASLHILSCLASSLTL